MQQSNFFPERSQYNFEQNEKALTKSSISHIGDLRSIECHCRMWSRESIAENPRYLTMSDDIDDDIKKYQKTLKIFFQNISWLLQVQSPDVRPVKSDHEQKMSARASLVGGDGHGTDHVSGHQ